jgi:hypothetical protein
MNILFAIAIYVGCGVVWSGAMIEPTEDNVVSALLGAVAVYYTLNQLPMLEAIKAARIELRKQNDLLRVMNEALQADSVEPLRKYFNARKR